MPWNDLILAVVSWGHRCALTEKSRPFSKYGDPSDTRLEHVLPRRKSLLVRWDTSGAKIRSSTARLCYCQWKATYPLFGRGDSPGRWSLFASKSYR